MSQARMEYVPLGFGISEAWILRTLHGYDIVVICQRTPLIKTRPGDHYYAYILILPTWLPTSSFTGHHTPGLMHHHIVKMTWENVVQYCEQRD